MTNEPRDLTSLDSESVIRFVNPVLPAFAQSQKIILSSEVIANINHWLTNSHLGALVDEGAECMFMGEGQATWQKGRLKLSAQLVLDEVNPPNQPQIYKNDFDVR